MTDLWLMGLTAAMLCLAIGLGFNAARTRWVLQQHKDQIEFLLDMVARQAVQQNGKGKQPNLMR